MGKLLARVGDEAVRRERQRDVRGQWTYGFNLADQLTGATDSTTGVGYGYDGDGNRVASTTGLVWDSSNRVRPVGKHEQHRAYRHYCHGVGLCGGEPLFVRHDSDEVLEAGMVITPEARTPPSTGLYAPEEDVVITEDGPRLLSPADAGLAWVGVA